MDSIELDVACDPDESFYGGKTRMQRTACRRTKSNNRDFTEVPVPNGMLVIDEEIEIAIDEIDVKITETKVGYFLTRGSNQVFPWEEKRTLKQYEQMQRRIDELERINVQNRLELQTKQEEKIATEEELEKIAVDIEEAETDVKQLKEVIYHATENRTNLGFPDATVFSGMGDDEAIALIHRLLIKLDPFEEEMDLEDNQKCSLYCAFDLWEILHKNMHHPRCDQLICQQTANGIYTDTDGQEHHSNTLIAVNVGSTLNNVVAPSGQTDADPSRGNRYALLALFLRGKNIFWSVALCSGLFVSCSMCVCCMCVLIFFMYLLFYTFFFISTLLKVCSVQVKSRHIFTIGYWNVCYLCG